MVTFFCILGICVALGCVFCMVQSTTNNMNLTVKTLSIVSCLMLALVSANLSSAFGGYTLFLAAGLSVIIGEETYRCVKYKDKSTASVWFLSGSNALSLLCFLLGGILLAPFTPWGMLAGVAAGLGATLLMIIFKKLSWSQWLAICLNVVIAAAMLGQGLSLIISGFEFKTAIMYMVAAFLITFQLIFSVFSRHDRTMRIVSNIVRIASLILIAASIYLLS